MASYQRLRVDFEGGGYGTFQEGKDAEGSEAGKSPAPLGVRDACTLRHACAWPHWAANG
jgi:hypothetical protein